MDMVSECLDCLKAAGCGEGTLRRAAILAKDGPGEGLQALMERERRQLLREIHDRERRMGLLDYALGRLRGQA